MRELLAWIRADFIGRRRLIVVASLLMGWMVTCAIWAIMTGCGAHYQERMELSRYATRGGFDYRVIQEDWRFRMQWREEGSDPHVQCHIFWAGRLVTMLELRSNEASLVLSADLPPYERRELEQRLGKAGAHQAQRMLFASGGGFCTPWARDVTVELPRGSIEPWLRQFVTGVLNGLDVEFQNETLRALTKRVAADLRENAGLDMLFESLDVVHFAWGPIQFVTCSVFMAALGLLALGFAATWLIASGRALTEVVPFVGFFGTLVGMGGALGILGNANLSDELSKALGLGPIGSQLSVAIETTKFALMLFLVLKVLDVIVSKGREVESMREAVSGVKRASHDQRVP